jgi:protocatechuate 3,4-dioxygenase beta subunit
MADSGIYTSTNSGATWQLQPGSPGSGPFVNGVIASSADGTRLYAGIDQDKNPLYVSTNSGLSWFTYAIAPAYVSFWGTQALICSTNGLQVYSIPAVVADTVLYLNFNSSLTGHVYRSFDSNSIASTTVEITSDDFQDLLAVTDDNGGYTLTNLPPGDYEITVSATNYVTLTTNITVGVDQHLTNDFYLNSQLSLTGNVYCNSTEDGVEDASILLGGVATTETDEDGGYIFHNVPADTLSVTVSPTFYSSTNFATLTTNVTITGKTDVQTKDFYVVPLVFGYVYSSFDSNAIIDATVEANGGEANGGEAVTDGGGAYSLTNLFPEDYVVTVSATNYAVLTTNITVGEDGQVTNNFYLNSLLSLTGHIYSSSTSNGLANVSLLLDGRAKVVTDATGAYTITNIPVSDPDDPWTLIVSATNFATLTTNVDITGATLVTTNDYYLDSLLAVEGKVYCSCDSNVITGASVHFGPLTALTDTNGAYAISNVPPGPFDVTVSATRFATLTNTVTVDGTQLVLTSDFYLTNQYFLILATYDPSIAATLNYQTALSTIAAAQQTFEADVADPLCLRLVYSAVSNGLASSRIPSGTISYNQYVADLAANTNLSALDQEAQASLNPPPNTGLLSNTLVQLTPALLDALGENDLADKARNGGPDGYIALNLGIMNLSRPGEDPNKYDLQSVVYHEIDEVLGIGGYGSVLLLTNAYTGQPLPTSGVGPLDLFRYTSKGVRSFAYSPDIAPYFSINGGASPLVCFNQFGSGSDFGDWGNGAVPATQSGNIPPQVQDAFATPGASPDLGVNELIALDIVGYTLSADSQIEAPAWSVGVFSFSAATLPGQTYQLQSAKSLAQPVWTDVGPPVVASGLVTVFTDASATGAEELYRLINIPASPVSPHVTRATRSQRTINRAESVGPTQTHHYLPRP